MKIIHTFVLPLAVILDSIESSSHASNSAPAFLPSDIPPSSSAEHDSLGSPNKFSAPAEPFLRERSRSPERHSPTHLLGYRIDEIRYLRLIPNSNPSQQFEIRRYTFSNDTQVHLREEMYVLSPMPTTEQTVLSTSKGEVLAILDGDKYLRGMYIVKGYTHKRVKMNIGSGAVKEMTRAEIQEAPLGKNAPILKIFKIKKVNESPPRLIRFPILNRSP